MKSAKSTNNPVYAFVFTYFQLFIYFMRIHLLYARPGLEPLLLIIALDPQRTLFQIKTPKFE